MKYLIILIIFFTYNMPNGRLAGFYSIPGVIGIASDGIDCFAYDGASRRCSDSEEYLMETLINKAN